MPTAQQPDTTAQQLSMDEQGSGSSSSPSATDQRSLTKDEAFHLLQNARRRAVLRHLLANDGREQFEMRSIAEEVAAWEHDTTVQQLSSDERQRVYIALYQTHLPKLDEYGVIEYNQSRGLVRRTPLAAVLAPFLEDGLHTDGDQLTVDGGDAAAAPDAGDHSQRRLTTAVASLLDL